jgi:hypothetical protein
MNMQMVTRLALAFAVSGGVALSAAAVSLTVATPSFAQSQPQCIPHYDSSGAQRPPYC